MKKTFSAAFCIALASMIYATDIQASLESLLPAESVTELLQQGKIQKTVYRQKGQLPSLAPDSPLYKECVNFWKGAEAPFFIETLYLYKKPAARQAAVGDDIANISIILRSLSLLKGIEYFSTSRQKMRILYDESYVVDNVISRKKIPDPVQGNADNIKIIAVQKDLTFGKYAYSYAYRQTQDSVAFFSNNIDPLYYTIAKIVEPDKLHVSLVIQDFGDYLLVYGLTKANFAAIPGLDSKLNASFSTRTEALYKWFIKEYEKQ